MFTEVNRFVDWVRRRNPTAYTWKSYTYDLRQFVSIQFWQRFGFSRRADERHPKDYGARYVRSFQATLRWLQQQEITIPNGLLSLAGLKERGPNAGLAGWVFC